MLDIQYLETEHGIFTDSKETGQSAEEVYQEWLISEEKPIEPQLSELDKLRIAQAEQFEYILELLEGMM